MSCIDMYQDRTIHCVQINYRDCGSLSTALARE